MSTGPTIGSLLPEDPQGDPEGILTVAAMLGACSYMYQNAKVFVCPSHDMKLHCTISYVFLFRGRLKLRQDLAPREGERETEIYIYMYYMCIHIYINI